MPTAGDKRIVFKASCTPQEKPSGANRFYLDSDVGQRLSGSYAVDLAGKDITFTSAKTITSTETLSTGTYDFVFVKCISGDDITISLDGGSNLTARCSSGESFVCELLANSRTIVIETDGTSDIEYLTGT